MHCVHHSYSYCNYKTIIHFAYVHIAISLLILCCWSHSIDSIVWIAETRKFAFGFRCEMSSQLILFMFVRFVNTFKSTSRLNGIVGTVNFSFEFSSKWQEYKKKTHAKRKYLCKTNDCSLMGKYWIILYFDHPYCIHIHSSQQILNKYTTILVCKQINSEMAN